MSYYSNRSSGTVQITGLNNGGLVTEVTLNSTTWTPLPPTALSGRNAMRVQNRSGIEIKTNYATVAGYVGMVVDGNGGEAYYDLTDQIVIYAKSTSGTPTVNVEEIS